MAELLCYGWHYNLGNNLAPELPLGAVNLKLENGEFSCEENCKLCLYDILGDVDIICQGVRDDGQFRFFFTARSAKRINGEVKCQLLPDEGKCPVCLLELRRIKPGR